MIDRVELQLEVDAPRTAVFALFASADGLRRWLDAAELESRVGGALRVQLRDAQATGQVLALDPPQHISFSWEWVGQRRASPSVVAFDAIDHGSRTHVTLRHVGLATRAEVELHAEIWRHWLDRFAAAVRALPAGVDPARP
ncbi:MAG TPA: SRPBCC domain-containing protein [Candidatus Limnocylindrales bacterium]|nr:SRPBCC domain-containing protein [Candidatus Limnocylindrales bacterium]